MSIVTRPYDGNNVAGDDGPYSSQNWRDVWFALFGNDDNASSNGANRGVLKGVYSNLRVVPNGTPDRSVDVGIGSALIQGMWLESDAVENIALAVNASGSTRIDVIVAQYNATAGVNVGDITVVQGTPGAGIPALTQNLAAIYQIPLAHVTCVNGYTTIESDDIEDARAFGNVPDVIALTMQNLSGAAVYGGDVVVQDTTNDDAFTTSTSLNADVCGVVEGYIPNNGWGRVITSGLGYVKTTGAVSRGDRLVQSTTAKKGIVGTAFSSFARALETGTDEILLCMIDVPYIKEILTTRGDVVYRNASGLARLAIGANGTVLNSDGTDPRWGNDFDMPTADYDSGYFSVTGSTTYTKAHGLASTPRIVVVWHSAVASPGAGNELVSPFMSNTGAENEHSGMGTDGTNVYIQTNSGTDAVIQSVRRASGTGYYRILAWV